MIAFWTIYTFWHPVHLMVASFIVKVGILWTTVLNLTPDYTHMFLVYSLNMRNSKYSLTVHLLVIIVLSLILPLLGCLFCWFFEFLVNLLSKKQPVSLKNGLILLSLQKWPELLKLGSWSLLIPDEHLRQWSSLDEVKPSLKIIIANYTQRLRKQTLYFHSSWQNTVWCTQALCFLQYRWMKTLQHLLF